MKEQPKCCQCSLPRWKGMFCPVCGATTTAECYSLSLAIYHGKTLGEIGEVLGKTDVRKMWQSGGPITKPIARAILSCLPRTDEIWHKAEECRRKLSHRLIARQEGLDKKRQGQSNEQNETPVECPI